MTHKLSILLVEDEKNICDFISTSLSAQDYRISTAHTGKEALPIITSQCPDLILLDLGLPDMDGMEIIRRYPEVTGVFHCYSGSLEMARELVSLGWYVGFTGVLTFKNARKALEVAENVPLYRLLLETDCPYMAPEPFRGRRCDSGMLHRTAEKLAELRGVSPEEIARITWENASRLFRIKL